MLDVFLFNRKRALLVVIATVASLSAYPFMLNQLNALGLSSRTLNLLLSSELFSHDSGRGEYYTAAQRLISEHPIEGIGIFGDRVYFDVYVHNFFYEVWLDYGILIGSLILLFFFLKSIMTFRKQTPTGKELLVRYFMAGVIPLFVSGSYLTDTSFGIYLGVLFLLSRSTGNRKSIKPKIQMT